MLFRSLFSYIAFNYINSKNNKALKIFSTYKRLIKLKDCLDLLANPFSAQARFKEREGPKTYLCLYREDASKTVRHY